MSSKQIFLARIQGFCSGVSTAIKIVERALEKYGTPLFVYHEIVHNTFVVEQFRHRGVVFVEDLADVAPGSRIIFSAHGIAPQVIDDARSRGLTYIDATCPLVKKVHREAVRFSREGRHVILIGHKGHQEMTGTAGYIPPALLHVVQNIADVQAMDLAPETPIAYVTQTTLSVDDAQDIIHALAQRFTDLRGPAHEDICYATQNRQDAVKDLAACCDVIIICGSPNSSNSNRLRETGQRAGINSYIIDNADELDDAWIASARAIGISSGASVPHSIVLQLIQRISLRYPGTTVASLGESDEPKIFPLPEI